MEVINISSSCDRDFIAQVSKESEQDPSLCYQCGNCTAGCPYNFLYDYPVHTIMRMLQLGQKEAILKSKSIWLCATCESCTTRCPNEIDVARIMDVLRHMARREGHVAEKNIKTFHDSFLGSVKNNGRVFEMGLMMAYNTRTGQFFNDAELGPKMMSKGKIAFKPHSIKGKDKVAKIFERFAKQGDE